MSEKTIFTEVMKGLITKLTKGRYNKKVFNKHPQENSWILLCLTIMGFMTIVLIITSIQALFLSKGNQIPNIFIGYIAGLFIISFVMANNVPKEFRKKTRRGN